jgi:hypothetical protein
MRARSVASEAARDLAAGTTRAAGLALAFAAVVGALAVADVRAAVDVLRGAAEYRQSGAAVQVLDAVEGVDGARCHALAQATGVVAAGALRHGEPVRALAMPSARLTVWEATPGLVDLLAEIGTQPQAADAGPAAGGLWYARDLADTVGARPGRDVATATGVAATAGVYTWPDDGRARTLGYAALAPVAPTGVFDQCWVQVWPDDLDAASLVSLALIPAKGEQAGISRLNAAHGASYDTARLLARRPTAVAPAAAAAVGLVLGYLAVRMRRLELASALHARVRKPYLAWQHALEAAAWAAAGVAVGAAAVAYAATDGNPDPSDWAFLLGARTLLAAAAAALLGTLLGVATTRERHLFRYFKNR